MKDQYSFDDVEDFLDAGEYLFADLALEDDDIPDKFKSSKQRIEEYMEQRLLRDQLEDYL